MHATRGLHGFAFDLHLHQCRNLCHRAARRWRRHRHRGTLRVVGCWSATSSATAAAQANHASSSGRRLAGGCSSAGGRIGRGFGLRVGLDRRRCRRLGFGACACCCCCCCASGCRLEGRLDRRDRRSRSQAPRRYGLCRRTRRWFVSAEGVTNRSSGKWLQVQLSRGGCSRCSGCSRGSGGARARRGCHRGGRRRSGWSCTARRGARRRTRRRGGCGSLGSGLDATRAVFIGSERDALRVGIDYRAQSHLLAREQGGLGGHAAKLTTTLAWRAELAQRRLRMLLLRRGEQARGCCDSAALLGRARCFARGGGRVVDRSGRAFNRNGGGGGGSGNGSGSGSGSGQWCGRGRCSFAYRWPSRRLSGLLLLGSLGFEDGSLLETRRLRCTRAQVGGARRGRGGSSRRRRTLGSHRHGGSRRRVRGAFAQARSGCRRGCGSGDGGSGGSGRSFLRRSEARRDGRDRHARRCDNRCAWRRRRRSNRGGRGVGGGGG